MIAAIILILLHLIGLGMKIEAHGRTKETKINAWHYLIAMIILFVLYYHAGVFNHFIP